MENSMKAVAVCDVHLPKCLTFGGAYGFRINMKLHYPYIMENIEILNSIVVFYNCKTAHIYGILCM